MNFVELDTGKDGSKSADVGVGVGASATGGIALTTVVWLSVVSVALFIVMAVSFRRWRYDCSSSGDSSQKEDEADDTMSVASSCVSDLPKCQDNKGYVTEQNPLETVNNVTVSTSC